MSQTTVWRDRQKLTTVTYLLEQHLRLCLETTFKRAETTKLCLKAHGNCFIIGMVVGQHLSGNG